MDRTHGGVPRFDEEDLLFRNGELSLRRRDVERSIDDEERLDLRVVV